MEEAVLTEIQAQNSLVLKDRFSNHICCLYYEVQQE